MKILQIIILLAFPVSLQSSKPFLAHVTCVDIYSEETYSIAAALWCECRNQSDKGKSMVVSAIRNGAHGYCSGKLEDRLVRFVAGEIKKPVTHRYRHWIRLEKATDKRQVRRAKKAIRQGLSLKVGAHYFY